MTFFVLLAFVLTLGAGLATYQRALDRPQLARLSELGFTGSRAGFQRALTLSSQKSEVLFTVKRQKNTRRFWRLSLAPVAHLGGRGRIVLVSRLHNKPVADRAAYDELIESPIGLPELDSAFILYADAPDFARGQLRTAAAVHALKSARRLGAFVRVDVPKERVLSISAELAPHLSVNALVDVGRELGTALSLSADEKPLPHGELRRLPSSNASGSPVGI